MHQNHQTNHKLVTNKPAVFPRLTEANQVHSDTVLHQYCIVRVGAAGICKHACYHHVTITYLERENSHHNRKLTKYRNCKIRQLSIKTSQDTAGSLYEQKLTICTFLEWYDLLKCILAFSSGLAIGTCVHSTQPITFGIPYFM